MRGAWALKKKNNFNAGPAITVKKKKKKKEIHLTDTPVTPGSARRRSLQWELATSCFIDSLSRRGAG